MIFRSAIIRKLFTSNITMFDKYIVCKNFILDNNKKEIYKNYYFKLAHFISIYLQNNIGIVLNNVRNKLKIDPYFVIKKKPIADIKRYSIKIRYL